VTAEWIRPAGADTSDLDGARRRGSFERNYDAGFQPSFASRHDSSAFEVTTGFLRLRLRDKRQSRSKSTSRFKSESRLRCAKEQWA